MTSELMETLSSNQSLPNIWLPGIVSNIARYLDDNEVPCTLRLVDQATAKLFAHQSVVRLDRPVPHHAFRDRWAKPRSMRHLKYDMRVKLLSLIAASGCLANLEVAVEQAGIDLNARANLCSVDLMAAAAKAGHIHVCEWLLQRGCPLDDKERVAWVAAQEGHQEVCTWLLNKGHPWNDFLVFGAAEGGHLDLMEWLLAQRPAHQIEPDKFKLLRMAVIGLDFPSFKRLYQDWVLTWVVAPDQQQEGDVPMGQLQQRVMERYNMVLCESAVRSTTPDWQAKVEFLEQQGCPSSPNVCTQAIGHPDAAERLRWLICRGFPVGREAVEVAAMNGNVSALQVLLAEGLGIQPDVGAALTASRFAAMGGHLPALKMLHAHGWLPDAAQLLPIVLRCGHKAVVTWLVEEAGVGLDVLRENLMHGYPNLELVTWLHEQGCRLEDEAFIAAAEAGDEPLMEWLLAHGYNYPEDATKYHHIELKGDMATLRCLQRLGCVGVDLAGEGGDAT